MKAFIEATEYEEERSKRIANYDEAVRLVIIASRQAEGMVVPYAYNHVQTAIRDLIKARDHLASLELKEGGGWEG